MGRGAILAQLQVLLLAPKTDLLSHSLLFINVHQHSKEKSSKERVEALVQTLDSVSQNAMQLYDAIALS